MSYLSNTELAEVFKDVKKHRDINCIVKGHLTNKTDVREMALNGIDLSAPKFFLDLGCGFGFFTEALRGKVNPDASITGIDCHPEYRDMYLNTCKQSGINGRFAGECTSSIRKMRSNSIDFILCSFALYFFPEIIPDISRILKADGTLVAITHSHPHMHEIGDAVRRVIYAEQENRIDALSFEILIDNFSGGNGEQLLSPWFGEIKAIEYQNSLVFGKENFMDFDKYFRFKQSFFIPPEHPGKENLIKSILAEFRNYVENNGHIEISKNDRIFVCGKPVNKGVRP